MSIYALCYTASLDKNRKTCLAGPCGAMTAWRPLGKPWNHTVLFKEDFDYY